MMFQRSSEGLRLRLYSIRLRSLRKQLVQGGIVVVVSLSFCTKVLSDVGGVTAFFKDQPTVCETTEAVC